MSANTDTTPQLFVPRRAERAADAMSSGTYDLGYPRDIISDAMHYAASLGLDPLSELSMAEHHFRAETLDTGDGTNEDGDDLARAPEVEA
jgi:hypothetical protein